MLIVEDGSGVQGANSYVTVEYADSYFTDRGRYAEFEGDLEQQEGWLIQATDYVELWRDQFLGIPSFAAQSLGFPRYHAPDELWMPRDLRRAVCEYAACAKLGPLSPTPKVDPTGHSVVMTSRKVGPVERSFAVVPGSRLRTRRSYPAADALLARILKPVVRQVIR